MVTRGERPWYDRPFETAAGLALAASGAVMVITMVVTGDPAFAPRYLREAHYGLVLVYGSMACAAGVMVIVGLWMQAYRDALRGRWTEAIGHLFTLGVGGTYAFDLTLGGFRSPANTLLLAFMLGRLLGSLGRMVVLVRRNFMVVHLLNVAVLAEQIDNENNGGDSTPGG